MSSQKRIRELSLFIQKHSASYYSGNPQITDAEFDEAWYELQQLDPNNPALDTIGEADEEAFEGFEKGKHIMFMHSQQKARNLEEFKKWLDKLPASHKTFRVDHKLDGLSIELIYRKGKLVKALTQGEIDGFDIVTHVSKMQGVPLTVDDYTGSLRGEMIMSPKIFAEKYQPQGYKNTRAAAIGLSKKMGGHLKDIQVVLYDSNLDVETHTEVLEHLESIEGARVVASKTFSRVKVFNGVQRWYEELIKTRDLVEGDGGLELEIDGLVVKSNAVNEKDAFRKKPNFQIAIKFPPQEKTTEILDIIWPQEGSTFTPLAILRAVELCNSQVKKATLHNPAILEGMDARVGSIVRVSKRGDIIPKVEAVIKVGGGPKTRPPSKCLTCQTPTKITKNRSRVYCPNDECGALIVHRVGKWLSTLEVKFFGDELIGAFVENVSPGYLYEIYDLEVDQMAGWMLSGKKVGKPTAQKVLKNLKDSSNDLPLEKFLGGLDIRTAGTRVFGFLVKAGYDLDSLREATEEELAQVKNIGPERAALIVKGLSGLADEIDGLLLDGRVTLKDVDDDVDETEPLGSVCFTGALSKPRKVMEETARKKGFEIKTGVSKGLTYLVTPDAQSGSAKNKKARELGTKVIDEEEFMGLLG